MHVASFDGSILDKNLLFYLRLENILGMTPSYYHTNVKI